MSTKPFLWALGAAAALLVAGTMDAKELSELKVLYIGRERLADCVGFLRPHVGAIEFRDRSEFKPAEAEPFDVVVLDWPQGSTAREVRTISSPLGRQRDAWHKPTVLLGSAGLNMAVSWKMKGGSGCTCMDPVAYGLRDHEIFERPFKIERQMKRIPTPTYFQDEIKEAEIEVLPLVDDITRRWRHGWCTYANDFAKNPDVEFFCGGVNHKTPTAAGLWRQGNFLHFGFEQSPLEMNETGKQLLLNSIAYISRFSEDLPIAITPSVFAGKVPGTRLTPARRLKDASYKIDWIKDYLAPALWDKLLPMGREKMAEWCEENAPFLYPNADMQLEVDEDLAVLGMPFDKPSFFERALADIGKKGDEAARARRLLERYVPPGPKGGSAEAWAAWWQENKSYAFASDVGTYRWYIDPLAKKRGIPSSELRGPKRADLTASVAGQ